MRCSRSLTWAALEGKAFRFGVAVRSVEGDTLLSIAAQYRSTIRALVWPVPLPPAPVDSNQLRTNPDLPASLTAAATLPSDTEL